jgi:hypothetical protein
MYSSQVSGAQARYARVCMLSRDFRACNYLCAATRMKLVLLIPNAFAAHATPAIYMRELQWWFALCMSHVDCVTFVVVRTHVANERYTLSD